MSDPAPDKLGDSEVSPESDTTQKRYLLDRYEGGLVVVLLALVVGTQFADQLVPTGNRRQLEIVRGADSNEFGPVNLLSPPDAAPLPARDLNTISKAELMAISGIGPAMAESILEHRSENGAFESLDGLLQVPGIGPKRLKQFSRYLTVPDAADLTEKPVSGNGSTDILALKSMNRPTESSDNSEKLLNLNQANRTQLMEIPGIGKSFADRILKQRGILGKFRTWDDLDEVSGIGPKRLENLKTHATIY